MADIYVVVWQLKIGSMSWYTQGFKSKLDYLDQAVKAAKAQIDILNKKNAYDGLWLFVAPEFSFMSHSSGTREHTGEADVAHLKLQCEKITTKYQELLLIPGSIGYKKKLYQRVRYVGHPRKKVVFVEHQPAYNKAIKLLEKFYDGRSEHMSDVQSLKDAIRKNATSRDKSTGRLGQASRISTKHSKLNLKRFDSKYTCSEEHRRQRVQLISNGFLVRNVAYGYCKGKKCFAFKKRINIEVDEGFSENLIYDAGSGDALWDWGGLSVGLEICADAGMGLLQYKKKAADIYIVIADSQDLGAINPPSCKCFIFVDSSRLCDVGSFGNALIRSKPKVFKQKFGDLSIVKVENL